MPASPALWSDRTTAMEIESGNLFQPHFDRDGLVPAIITDRRTHAILMFAWMNDEALSLTLSTGYAHFWSRSRQRIWQKGEESGNRLRIAAAYTDCDQDVLHFEVEVEGDGVACHTGALSCFYRRIETGPSGVPARLTNLGKAPAPKR